MNIHFTAEGWEDYQYWVTADSEVLQRLNRLIEDVRRNPFRGLGKPEPLKGDLTGWWSRRLTTSDRLVYRVKGRDTDQRIEIVQCRYHYGD